MKKRALSLFLTLTMLLGLFPAAAFAADTQPAPPITAVITGYHAGALVMDRENAPVLDREVEVSDLNADGQITLDEGLKAAHAAFLTSEDYVTAQGPYGTQVTRLWGVDTVASGYFRNHVMTGVVDEEVLADGDRITAFVYSDTDGWSDRYTYFTPRTKTACVGQEFQLTATVVGWMGEEPLKAAPIGVLDEDWSYAACPDLKGELVLEDPLIYGKPSTDAAGTAHLTFLKEGVYQVTAPADDSSYHTYEDDGSVTKNGLVPPVCTVTVLSEEEYAAHQVRITLEEAADALTWESLSSEPMNAVTLAPTLPAVVEAGGREISVSWASTNPALSVQWGAFVDRPAAQDAVGVLTATLTLDGQSVTREFTVTVKAEGVSPDKTTVVEYGPLMETIAAGYSTSQDAWTVLDMAAYNGSKVKGESYGTSSAAPVVLANAAIAAENTPQELEALKALDASGPYAIYTIPYLSLAYEAAGLVGEESHAPQTLKTKMLEALTGLNEFSETDLVAFVLAGLAPWYGNDEGVKTAVDGALSWLSQSQNGDGTFSNYGTPNANTSAVVVVALSALGVDAHTDARFIKEGHSAVEGLLTFALRDNSGFGYKGNVTRNLLSTEQGFRALVAYARMKDSGKAYNIYLQAGNSTQAVPAPGIQVTPKPEEGGGSSGGDSTFRIWFTMTVPKEEWIPRRAMTMDRGDTVYDAFTEACGRAGITYVGAEQGYVTSVTKEDVTYTEQDCGPDSGWVYTVNGTMPSAPLTEYTLSAGDEVVWNYTTDWHSEPGAFGGGSQEKEPELPFTDMKDHWAAGAVAWAYEQKLVSGMDEDTFAPDLPMTRAMLVTILYQLEGAPSADPSGAAADVSAGDWFASAAAWALDSGVAAGVGENCFDPHGVLTREQLAVMLYGYSQLKGRDTLRRADLTGYSDCQSVSTWALDQMEWARAWSVITGRTQTLLDPQSAATRGETVTMLQQFTRQVLNK